MEFVFHTSFEDMLCLTIYGKCQSPCLGKQWRESCGKTSSGNSMRLYRRENRSTLSKVLEAVNCESSFTRGNLEFANIAFLPGKLGSKGGVPSAG